MDALRKLDIAREAVAEAEAGTFPAWRAEVKLARAEEAADRLGHPRSTRIYEAIDRLRGRIAHLSGASYFVGPEFPKTEGANR